MRTASIILFLTLLLLSTGRTLAAPSYTADLSGPEVVPPTESTATAFLELIGTCDASSADSTSLLFNVWQIGLVDAERVYLAHGAQGTNGPVLYDVVSGPFWLTTGTVSVSPAHCEWFDAGEIYIVITTYDHPDGEIRGQVIPDPSPVLEHTWGRVKSLFRDVPQR
ncbi:MAG: CHRD domain-containing protein [Candidatus Eisenbacteria bacterium]|uniref:CHRD domain-containing protein n=1 Tax=Eiseniibacteriota bacterium TaxID=2212470 RepID=A0A956NIN4_UNCEI|nr:CHRD domain-containing protein [Candidatus Eisenbacteria bacterium]